jgi:hypothetical protein
MMARDMWFKDELACVLASKRQAAVRDKSGGELEGYLSCLEDLAVEFGHDQTATYDLPRESWINSTRRVE